MNKTLSWINFISCIGWLIFWVILISTEGADMFRGEELFATIGLLTTVSTGIYLFVVGVNRQYTRLEAIKADNLILQAKIEQAKLQKELSNN